MRNLLLLICASSLMLVACDGQKTKSTADPTFDRIELLRDYMAGTMTSAAQAASDTNYFDITLDMVPIWEHKSTGFWLYVEQAVTSMREKPYRQRVYHLQAVDSTHFSSSVYSLPKASRFIGNHKSLGVVQEYAGTIVGVIDGTPYSGDFTEEAHGAHGHSHGPDDALVWEGETREHAGLKIQLGHHGKQLHAGEEVEPAVSIVRDGKPVDDAKVFNALVSADGQTVLAKEVATVYEPTTDDEPAHYAQGALAIPSGVSKVILRFRIVPAGADPVTFDVPVTVE